MSNFPPGVTEANLPGSHGDLYELDVDYSDTCPAPGEWTCETTGCDAGIGWQEYPHDTYDYDEVKWAATWERPDGLLICDDCANTIADIENRAQAEIDDHDRSQP